VQSVLEYGERVSFETGVGLVDTPPYFEEAATALAAAGTQIVVHAAQDGHPAGHPIVPVLKITSQAATYRALSDAIDAYTEDVAGPDLRKRLLDAANRTKTKAEDHGLTAFSITRAGPST